MGKEDLGVNFCRNILTIKSTNIIIFVGTEGAPVCSMQDLDCVQDSRST